MNSKGVDQTTRMRKLIWAVVGVPMHVGKNSNVLMTGLIMFDNPLVTELLKHVRAIYLLPVLFGNKQQQKPRYVLT